MWWCLLLAAVLRLSCDAVNRATRVVLAHRKQAVPFTVIIPFSEVNVCTGASMLGEVSKVWRKQESMLSTCMAGIGIGLCRGQAQPVTGD